MNKESVTLYYCEGTSDKVYQAAIESLNGGFVVSFAYGRRGSTMNTGTKTQSPVPYDQAKVIFDKLIQSKTAKGYTPGEDGTPYTHTDSEKEITGIHCQLCNFVEESKLADLLADNDWWLQEKHDGERRLIRKDNAGVVGINRKGLIVSLPSPIVRSAQAIPGEFILDGESIGDVLHVFDVLSVNGQDQRSLPYQQRYLALMNLLARAQQSQVKFVQSAVRTAQKSELLMNLRTSRKEGVVFKRYDAPYTAGKPASGGTWLKFKFTTTGSFIVSRINEQRSVGLHVLDGRKRVDVGNVTIPANKDTPAIGDVVEVRYLYAYKGGSLFQPVYIGVRDDIDARQCSIKQLKYKAADTDEEES